MIVTIKGKLIDISPTYVVLDCMGLGYNLGITLNTYSNLKQSKIGEEIFLHTYFLVKEDRHSLYGFWELSEREMFTSLLKVSGLGASKSMLILSFLRSNELKKIILSGDFARLKSVKGIGEKTAKRIILELKDKIDKIGVDISQVSEGHNSKKQEAMLALDALGISKNNVSNIIDSILDKNDSIDVERLIKEVLKVI